MNDRIYVTRPNLPPLDELLPYLETIWETRILTNGGPFHARLEQELADYLGVQHVCLFNNATVALIVALQALGIQGEVITTPYSFVATAHSILWNGLQPVFADIDPESLNIDPARVEEAVTDDTTAILGVHVYGVPCDVHSLASIGARSGIRILYDAAHAFGVELDGQSILNHGDLSVLSFHATKVFNTFEGGAIVCSDPALKKKINFLKNFGFQDEVTVVSSGINGKMNELQAAVGLLQLKRIDDAIAGRGKVDAAYREGLAGIPGIRLMSKPRNATANHSYFPIFVEAGFPVSRDRVFEALREQDIIARRYFYPLISSMPMYRGLPSAAPSNLPVATRIADEVICLPIYPDLEMEVVDKVVGIIRTLAQSGQRRRSVA